MPLSMKPRDHCFDSLKCILIFLAVLGHLLTLSPAWGGWNDSLYRVIYSFHMPVFLFITGWFAVYKRRTIIFHLLYLYFLFQTLHCVIFRGLLKDDPILLEYTTPSWSLWYLMVCLFCYLLIPLFNLRGKRRRGCVLALFFFLSVFYGLDPTIGKFLSLGRVFSFLPFFALGYYAKDYKDTILHFSKKPVSVALTLGVLAATVYLAFFCRFPNAMFYGSHSFERLGCGVATKLLIQAIACLWLAFFLLVVAPALNRKIPVMSTAGKNTLAVYLLHAFPLKLMGHFELTANFTPLHTLLTALVILLAFGNDTMGRLFSRLFTGWWLEKLWNKMEPRKYSVNHYDQHAAHPPR